MRSAPTAPRILNESLPAHLSLSVGIPRATSTSGKFMLDLRTHCAFAVTELRELLELRNRWESAAPTKKTTGRCPPGSGGGFRGDPGVLRVAKGERDGTAKVLKLSSARPDLGRFAPRTLCLDDRPPDGDGDAGPATHTRGHAASGGLRTGRPSRAEAVEDAEDAVPDDCGARSKDRKSSALATTDGLRGRRRHLLTNPNEVDWDQVRPLFGRARRLQPPSRARVGAGQPRPPALVLPPTTLRRTRARTGTCDL